MGRTSESRVLDEDIHTVHNRSYHNLTVLATIIHLILLMFTSYTLHCLNPIPQLRITDPLSTPDAHSLSRPHDLGHLVLAPVLALSLQTVVEAENDFPRPRLVRLPSSPVSV